MVTRMVTRKRVQQPINEQLAELPVPQTSEEFVGEFCTTHDTMTLRKQLFVVSSEIKNNKRTTRLLRLVVSDGPEVREEGR